jgi:hypothetical protein
LASGIDPETAFYLAQQQQQAGVASAAASLTATSSQNDQELRRLLQDHIQRQIREHEHQSLLAADETFRKTSELEANIRLLLESQNQQQQQQQQQAARMQQHQQEESVRQRVMLQLQLQQQLERTRSGSFSATAYPSQSILSPLRPTLSPTPTNLASPVPPAGLALPTLKAIGSSFPASSMPQSTFSNPATAGALLNVAPSQAVATTTNKSAASNNKFVPQKGTKSGIEAKDHSSKDGSERKRAGSESSIRFQSNKRSKVSSTSHDQTDNPALTLPIVLTQPLTSEREKAAERAVYGMENSRDGSKINFSGQSISEITSPTTSGNAALVHVAAAIDRVQDANARKGTIENLLLAANTEEKISGAAHTLLSLKTLTTSEFVTDDDTDALSYDSSQSSVEYLDSFNVIYSGIPNLPEEPCLEYSSQQNTPLERNTRFGSHNMSGCAEERQRMASNILDYPLPVDTWWPSVATVRRERRQNNETTDEDDFVDEPNSSTSASNFRANEKRILRFLETKTEPGVLEKLPHCLLHRIRTKKKKNSTAPELVYCWQVSDIYPNDVMVNCSQCGTWRHARCGGHYRPYSSRDNTKRPFVALCDFCYYEQHFMKENSKGAKRIERQRMEQLRRALMTSAVMRHASFSKHVGTYKWPIGSVAVSHIGGHTRSVHARHDKAEKQWGDMISRLSRGVGYRPKDRIRVRTKELERLLVSVEDAEGATDRHNMLVFLVRDTQRATPIGFENPRVNIFDPADDNELMDMADFDAEQSSETEQSQRQSPTNHASETNNSRKCVRPDCSRNRRFDSVFCSDACGVNVLSHDLLLSFYESIEIHPSVLRS